MRPFSRHPIAATARRWLLWLALLLGVAQTLAAWHVYSHHPLAPAGAAAKSAHPAAEACVVCLAAAGIGGPAGATPAWQLPPLRQPGPAWLPPPAPPPAASPRPYAIRAPPAFVS